MKIAVVTIVKNEAMFVERWAKSASEADLLLIGDTGSTDDTRERASLLGVQTVDLLIEPWRFDDARNALLALVPGWIDVIVTLDMDEVLAPGWRDALEEAGPGADRYRYDYIWSWLDDGRPDVMFRGERCVSRSGWRWKHPVHETLFWQGEGHPVEVDGGFRIEHHPDNDKPRSQYLPLLEKAARESPDDDRTAHYYARELYFAGDWNKARTEFQRHLALPTALWADERAQSLRYLAKMDYHPERWLLKAAAEAPHRREAWVDLAVLYRDTNRPGEAKGMVARALSIPSEARSGSYLTETRAWDDEYVKSLAVAQ